MLTANQFLKQQFGKKIYKISLDAGFTCPNRDGKLGTRGCIFCSGRGSGDYTFGSEKSVTEQLALAKALVAEKKPEGYIAYFQAFTNTYAPVERLRVVFTEAIKDPEVVALSVATRPDCLPEDVCALLSELNGIKPVIVELGLQTVHEETANYIRRGYTLSVYDEAVQKLHAAGIKHVITHVILGLPGETREDMLETVKYVAKTADGIKLQLLHILRGTDLAEEYEKQAANAADNGGNASEDRKQETGLMQDPKNETGLRRTGENECRKIRIPEREEYAELVAECLELLPENFVVHRMTGDGARKDLIAPLWSLEKKKTLNAIKHAAKARGIVF